LTTADERKRRRGIYLLPSLFTTGALFAGFFAIVAALQGNFTPAAIAILIAMVLDGLDGRVARMTDTQSDFGAEYDSLSDMVSFGVAPALIVYEWSLKHVGEIAASWSQLGWLVAFIYTACCALRLARFNTQVGKADKRFFQGLASPSAAAVMVGMVWVARSFGISGQDLMTLAFVVTLASGLLMVTSLPYYSFKDLGGHRRVPFITMLAVVMLFVFATIDPPVVIFAGFALYALSGPAWWGFRRLRRRGRRHAGAGGEGEAGAPGDDPGAGAGQEPGPHVDDDAGRN